MPKCQSRVAANDPCQLAWQVKEIGTLMYGATQITLVPPCLPQTRGDKKTWVVGILAVNLPLLPGKLAGGDS